MQQKMLDKMETVYCHNCKNYKPRKPSDCSIHHSVFVTKTLTDEMIDHVFAHGECKGFTKINK